jgi:putative transposase
MLSYDELVIRRRKLPHWRSGAKTYHVTFRSRLLIPPAARQLVVDAVRKGEAQHFNLFLGLVMPDHVHLLLFPCESSEGQWRDLSDILQGLKGASARSVNKHLCRRGNLWQDESYDRIIRNRREYRATWNYIWLNPCVAGLTDSPDEYPYLIYPSETSAKRILNG